VTIGREPVIVGKDSAEKQLPLDQTRKFSELEPEKIKLSIGDPFFSLSPSRYFGDKEKLCLYWPLETVVSAGPKVLDFYAGFCARRATCLKADGKDIKVLNLILSGNSDGASECPIKKNGARHLFTQFH
jgi:hypothetical protein